MKSHFLNDVVKLFSVLCCARQLIEIQNELCKDFTQLCYYKCSSCELSLSINNGKGGKQKLCTMKSEVRKYFLSELHFTGFCFWPYPNPWILENGLNTGRFSLINSPLRFTHKNIRYEPPKFDIIVFYSNT